MYIAKTKSVAIVNYGAGNLFSVKQACETNGLSGIITSSPQVIDDADAVILPGVGAFGSAMKSLETNNLIHILKKAAFSGKPFIGICLGMQLLFEKSHEFGLFQGLGIIKGEVTRFNAPMDQTGTLLKIPHVGWNKIVIKNEKKWESSLFHTLSSNSYMYFVHTYCAHPEEDVILTTTKYGDEEFCSSVVSDNILGCQFHPEKSGMHGLAVYQNLASMLTAKYTEPNAVLIVERNGLYS